MKSRYNGYTFKLNENVNREKVFFNNRYGIKLCGDLYIPKNLKDKAKAIAICGPFGAVKEQSSGLYADELASRGFVAMAFDPSFIGESGGNVRNVASPDINTEDFSAAVDFLSVQANVDADSIGVLGICGFGGLAINAASFDTRIKATVASTMYDMCRVNSNGYFDGANTAEARYETKKALSSQRTVDFEKANYARAGGVADEVPVEAPFFVKDYFDYYKTERGYSERSLNSNDGWNVTSTIPFMKPTVLSYPEEIRSAVMVMHGEKAHSYYFGRDTFNKLKGSNKELLIIPNAVHTDLYDKKDIIPFDKIQEFYNKNM